MCEEQQQRDSVTGTQCVREEESGPRGSRDNKGQAAEARSLSGGAGEPFHCCLHVPLLSRET